GGDWRFLGGDRRLPAGIVLAQQPLQLIQTTAPEALVKSQPFMGAGQRTRYEAAEMRAPAHVAADQASAFQRLDVLGGCGKRDGEGFGKLAHRALAIRKLAQHAPPRRIAEGVENGVQFGRKKLNHVVEYMRTIMKVNLSVEYYLRLWLGGCRLAAAAFEQAGRLTVICRCYSLAIAELARDGERRRVSGIDDADRPVEAGPAFRPCVNTAEDFGGKALAVRRRDERPPGLRRAFDRWNEVALEVMEPGLADETAGRLLLDRP